MGKPSEELKRSVNEVLNENELKSINCWSFNCSNTYIENYFIYF